VANQLAANSMPKVFRCPSALRGSTDTNMSTQKDYSINGGTNANCCPERRQDKQDGVAFVNSTVRLLDIKDGTSNTFLFVEKANYFDQSWLPDTYGSNHFIFVHHPSQGYVAFDNLTLDSDNFNNRAPQSYHQGGVLAALADGHVVFVSRSINLATYRALFTRATGDLVGSY
jgi:hypothetical protein